MEHAAQSGEFEASWPIRIGDGGGTASVSGAPGLVTGSLVDCQLDWGHVGAGDDRVEIRSASIRGRSHRYKDTPRQDSFGLGRSDDGRWLIVAVADGVGNSPRSELAAESACAVGVESLTAQLRQARVEDVDWSGVVEDARVEVLCRARDVTSHPTLEPREAADVMATTLLLATVEIEPEDRARRRCVVLALGDTSAWVLRADREWEPLTPIKNQDEEIASSSVFALPLVPDVVPAPVVADLEPGDVFFAFTDGIGDPLLDGKGAVGRELARRWATPPSPYEFGNLVDFARRTHVDDRTAVGVWAPAGTTGPDGA